MTKKKALTDTEVSKINRKNFYDWVKMHRKMICAKSGKSVFYAGGKYDVEISFDKNSDEAILKNTKMWQVIKRLNDNRKKSELPTHFETLEDVLMGIRSHPIFIDRDQVEKHFAQMYEYMKYLKKFPKLFFKAEEAKCWSELSRAYAGNAKGNIAFFDGVTNDYKILQKDKIFIKDELMALLKNPDLSNTAKVALGQKIGKYLKQLDAETKSEIKMILNERKNLLANVKNALSTKKA